MKKQIDSIEFFKDRNNFIGKTVVCDLKDGLIVYAINVMDVSDDYTRMFPSSVIRCKNSDEKSISNMPAYNFTIHPLHFTYYVMENDEAEAELRNFYETNIVVRRSDKDIVDTYLKRIWHSHQEVPDGIRNVITFDGERFGNVGQYISVNEGYVWAYMDDIYKFGLPESVKKQDEVITYNETHATVEITQEIIDYVEEHRRFFELEKPNVGEIWTLRSIEEYPIACDGKPVCVIENERGDWMRLPKDMCIIKYE